MSLNTWAKGNLGDSLEIGASGSESSGGGGSFVTFVMDNTAFARTAVFLFPAVIENEVITGTIVWNEEAGGGVQSVKVPLYEGKAFVLYLGTWDDRYQLSGGIEIFMEDQESDITYLVVTGDCKITF